ncbi:hypothetical protein CsatB_002274 [Cannabis sativa]
MARLQVLSIILIGLFLISSLLVFECEGAHECCKSFKSGNCPHNENQCKIDCGGCRHGDGGKCKIEGGDHVCHCYC